MPFFLICLFACQSKSLCTNYFLATSPTPTHHFSLSKAGARCPHTLSLATSSLDFPLVIIPRLQKQKGRLEGEWSLYPFLPHPPSLPFPFPFPCPSSLAGRVSGCCPICPLWSPSSPAPALTKAPSFSFPHPQTIPLTNPSRGQVTPPCKFQHPRALLPWHLCSRRSAVSSRFNQQVLSYLATSILVFPTFYEVIPLMKSPRCRISRLFPLKDPDV